MLEETDLKNAINGDSIGSRVLPKLLLKNEYFYYGKNGILEGGQIRLICYICDYISNYKGWSSKIKVHIFPFIFCFYHFP